MHNNYLVLPIICNISFDWLYANMRKAELLILSQKLTISVNTYVTKNNISGFDIDFSNSIIFSPSNNEY